LSIRIWGEFNEFFGHKKDSFKFGQKLHNMVLQSDRSTRYARKKAADAGRYATQSNPRGKL